MTVERYAAQVALLVRMLPEIAEEESFALKGGTAINLFIRDLPRLSVDIDLTYLPVAERAESLAGVTSALNRIADRVRARTGAEVQQQGAKDGTRLLVRSGATAVKIEANPVLRGTVFEPELRSVRAPVEDRFGYAEIQVVSIPDLYAGKIAAALDRQHPRDLFDILYLLSNEGITDDLFTAFLVYLVSHNRPPHELLAPHLLDLSAAYHGEFAGMTLEEVSLEQLLGARDTLITEISHRSRQPPARGFLRSFYSGQPEWTLLGLDTDVAALPAVRWKLLNLAKLASEQPAKFKDQVTALDDFLGA
ncbi:MULTISPECIES: nucleotidyl transferase AbiEii/AbiGii toxin family protein [Sphingomonas]|jgi:predicted nucleotidyltransferase component of viral defense system|uniref:Nucleotidyl transferase AbiEii/AbiGii toxin family protein n=1 Tax=Sphingomonas aracearum TaxID=2283317 RepID=A0A369VQE7_9SPHN|nr:MULTISPECIES: nucleotidyl transferase AbiEii/AbiGii toxin family protein [Sphingomonas]MCH4894328.1 nucleotidyl transferase AbiEii/AbiGii toxin family protein [Sphingomonas sp. SFZ2018-12]RDE04233.1 nucleotidyl transferase AbiEii/AbiGii toxin family protein [Sphingomonas aracearum]